MIIKILLSGDGGQGIQLMSDLICRSVIEAGFFVSHIPNYGLEQKGGVSIAFIKISDNEIAYPKFSKPDLMVVLSEVGIMNYDIGDFKTKLEENKIPYQSYNIFFLNKLAKTLEDQGMLKRAVMGEMLEKKLSTKFGWAENKRAWELASEL